MQKTIIQNTAVVPYVELFVFNFLYTPIGMTIKINNETRFIQEMYDKIDENGITRYIRLHIK